MNSSYYYSTIVQLCLIRRKRIVHGFSPIMIYELAADLLLVNHWCNVCMKPSRSILDFSSVAVPIWVDVLGIGNLLIERTPKPSVHESLAGLYGRLLLNLRGAKAILYNGQSPFRFVPRLEMVDLSARTVDLAENSTSSVNNISSACNAILYRHPLEY
jgi:hypothetical protein